MTKAEYLDLEDALRLIRALGVGPVRDLGLLDSAVARPRSSAFGVDAYETTEIKTAALLHSLTANHPLVDGNKRLAWLATVVFLDVNELEPKVSDDEAFDLVWEVASGESDLTIISSRLRVQQRRAYLGALDPSPCAPRTCPPTSRRDVALPQANYAADEPGDQPRDG